MFPASNASLSLIRLLRSRSVAAVRVGSGMLLSVTPPRSHPSSRSRAPAPCPSSSPEPGSRRPPRIEGSGERALIAALRRTAARQGGPLPGTGLLRLGIGDDCAILRVPAGDELVVTTDLFLEQVHFRRDWHQPEVAGHRCLARGLSDIAAMGGTPVAAFLSFALPAELRGDWARRFLAGLLRLARLHHVPLAGGDTAQAPAAASSRWPGGRAGMAGGRARGAAGGGRSAPGASLFAADIVLLGRVPQGQALLRSGAQPGDLVYVTGSLGGAAAELARLEQAPGAYARLLRSRGDHPHLFPQPRLAAGQLLRGRATAAIDLSDGLSTDLAHLCEESGAGAEIEAALVPIHPLAARNRPEGLALALHGGEDYELLFTAPARHRLPHQIAGTPIHRVGRIVKAGRGRPRVTLIQADGSRGPLRNQGWEHFRPTP